MTIPQPDPNFTDDDLQHARENFIAAGRAYWEATYKAGLNLGAVVWLRNDESGEVAIFTRGEYADYLIEAVENL